jgi:N-acetyl sugar amidotransferase
MKNVCPRCLMDATAVGWRLLGDGCTYCELYFARENINKENQVFQNKTSELNKIVNEIKIRNKASKYDGIFGLSGGLDSCYALHKLVQLGLNPLVVHMDNGWNTELASNNIEKLVTKLGLDYETHIIKWSTYRKLQIAFLNADVVDIEMLYDQAASGTCSNFASKYDCKTILTGSNHSTEGMPMPENWSYVNKLDERNIRAIWKKFGDGTSLETFPFFSTKDFLKQLFLSRVKWVSILDYLEYNREEAITELTELYEFKPYPFKHYESVFTRFYQGYLLPKKFGIDKRKVHLSSLVLSGQLSRQEAATQLEESAYPDADLLARDKEYFLKRMSWTEDEFSSYLQRKEVPHSRYGNEMRFYEKIFLPAMKVYRFVNSPIKLSGKMRWIFKKALRSLANAGPRNIGPR